MVLWVLNLVTQKHFTLLKQKFANNIALSLFTILVASERWIHTRVCKNICDKFTMSALNIFGATFHHHIYHQLTIQRLSYFVDTKQSILVGRWAIHCCLIYAGYLIQFQQRIFYNVSVRVTNIANQLILSTIWCLYLVSIKIIKYLITNNLLIQQIRCKHNWLCTLHRWVR